MRAALEALCQAVGSIPGDSWDYPDGTRFHPLESPVPVSGTEAPDQGLEGERSKQGLCGDDLEVCPGCGRASAGGEACQDCFLPGITR